MTRPPRLILASASPRRSELLGLLGIRFEIRAADVDEAVSPGELATRYVERLARVKAEALAAPPEDFVLAADTSVVVDERVLGKPGDDPRLGATMLRQLSGRAHQVLTGVAVAHQGVTRALVVSTQVELRLLSEPEIRWYVESGEGRDKAGGYALQGRAGAFVTSVVGSPTNVIGLPLSETAGLLASAGFPLPWSER
jgi:septum formation protein